ncbi:metalloregulator ArsR/SmtB family transcription factor [Rhodococcus sp. HNM0569]|uniref:helix-turn-helix domain-containing protein n=1 Tax=Rhodococcus sp. HNM0569 TaxID=2716340 RepID=UPI00146EEA8B|nr:transcriptional regulator [Rhodococcus sp. HNM0569]
MKTDDAAHVDGAAGPVAGDARPGTAGAERSGSTHDGDTRAAVVELLLQEGPVTAGEIGARLGLSAAGVRRHLDALLDAGEAREVTSRTRRRGRGRPAKHFQITAQGRRRLGHAYDDLAGAALRQLREVGGDAAIEEFARRRVQSIVSSVPRARADASDVADKAEAVATAFNDAGFAASTRPVGHGVQICQHHCPVSHVAEEFPELCEAERAALTEILGTHVQQLATIANGDVACTTHVPLAVHPPPPR